MMRKETSTEQKMNTTNLFYGYVKLIILFIVTILLVLFIRNLYLNKVNYKLNIPVISETLHQEINRNEIYNFVRENPNAVIYVCAVQDDLCRTFELDFNRIIRKRKLEDEVVYLNLGKTNKISSFFKEFNKFYGSSLEKYPSILVFENGKVEDILKIPVGDQYSSRMVEEFLDQHQVVSQ
ncbi:MAG: hypothetical protein HFG40_03220 [Bacilli bacterium]|nr:hypothetical protein [Bacilli bacterium]